MDFGICDQAIGNFGAVLDLLLLHMGAHGGLDLHDLVSVRRVSYRFKAQLQDDVEAFGVFLGQLLFPGLQRGFLALRAFHAGKLRCDNAIASQGRLRTRR